MNALFEVLRAWAWAVFALCAVVFVLGTATLYWHILELRCRRYVYLACGSGLLFALGFVLGGIQAGDAPVVDRQVMIPWVRLAWLAGCVMGMMFLTIYWLRRLQWRRR